MNKLLASGILLLAAGFCLSQPIDVGPLRVTPKVLSGGKPSTIGYDTLNITVENPQQKAHSLEARVHHSSSYGHTKRYTQAMTVPAQSTARMKIRLWKSQTPVDLITFLVDGKPFGEPMPLRNLGVTISSKPYLSGDMIILKDNQTPSIKENLVQYIEATKFNPSTSGLDHNDIKQMLHVEDASVDQWGDQWLDYTPYHVVQVGDAQFQQMSEQQKAALRTWLQCGGNLILRDSSGVPQEWKNAEDPLDPVDLGMGRMWVIPTDQPLNDEQHKEVMETVFADKNSEWEESGPSRINDSFPVATELNLPVRAFFAILVIFALLIGPVNYFYLASRNRRVWMLAAIPIISLITTLCIAGYAAYSERNTSAILHHSFVVLNQLNREAVISEKVGYYSPFSQSSLRFESNTYLMPVMPGNSGQLELDWTDGQTLESGWIRAREPFFYRTVRKEIRRERITFQSENGVQTATNNLGEAVISLKVTDDEGRVYNAENIGVGETVTLEMGGESAAPIQGSRQYRHPDWIIYNDQMERYSQPDGLLRLKPGRYLALLNRAPFAEIEHDVHTRKERTLVHGVWGGQW